MDRPQGPRQPDRVKDCSLVRLRMLPQREDHVLPRVRARRDVLRRRDDGGSPFGKMSRHGQLPFQRLYLRVSEVAGSDLGHDRCRGEVHDRVVGVLEDARSPWPDPQLARDTDSCFNRLAPSFLRPHAPSLHNAPLPRWLVPCPPGLGKRRQPVASLRSTIGPVDRQTRPGRGLQLRAGSLWLNCG
jgi:hypothetical protein